MTSWSVIEPVPQRPDFVLQLLDHGLLGVALDVDDGPVVDELGVVGVLEGAEALLVVHVGGREAGDHDRARVAAERVLERRAESELEVEAVFPVSQSRYRYISLLFGQRRDLRPFRFVFSGNLNFIGHGGKLESGSSSERNITYLRFQLEFQGTQCSTSQFPKHYFWPSKEKEGEKGPFLHEKKNVRAKCDAA